MWTTIRPTVKYKNKKPNELKMKTIPQPGKLLILCLLSFFVITCSNNDDDVSPETENEISTTDGNPNATPSLPNIVRLAGSVDMLSTLLDAIDTADAGIAETLLSEGAFTVFAPSNDAFTDLFDQLEDFDTLADFDEAEEKQLLALILQYHVIADNEAFSSNLTDGTVLTTLQTEELNIIVDGSVFVQDKTDELAEVIGADNDASNGVVHIVDKIVLPQAALDVLFPKPSLVELVMDTEELSLLEEAVIKANLVDALNGEGPFTVFAPTNAAIEELFTLLGDTFTSFDDFDNFLELQILEQILLYHVVPANLNLSDLTPGPVNTLLENEMLEIVVDGNTFVLGDASDINANIITPDQEASNGVVHLIDKILIPQEIQDFLNTINPDDPSSGLPTLKELVENSEELEFLEAALKLTGLLETLGEDGPFTVFAPTSETISFLFALIGGSIGSIEDFDLDSEIDILRKVLSYHVVPGTFTSADLTPGNLTTLLPNDGFEVADLMGELVLVDGLHLPVHLLDTDIPAKNGIIHTINRVMVPETVRDAILTETEQNFLDHIGHFVESDQFVYAFMLVRDSFEDVLEGDGFTLFLPNNSAFLELFEDLEGVESLEDFDTIDELYLLGEILLYHCVQNSTILSSSLFNDKELKTVQGETLKVKVGNGVFILDKTDIPAKITSPDIEVLNGVIHTIDKVLPPGRVLHQISS